MKLQALLFSILLCLSPALALPPLTVKVSTPKATPGYILYPTAPESKVILYDHKGEPLHSWDLKTVRARLTEQCTLVAIADEKIVELDWNGKQIWEVEAEGEIHHDFERLSNGNTIFLIKKNFRYLPRSKEAEDPEKERKVRSDIIREVNQEGKTVWEWHFDHELDYYSCGAKPCPKGAESTVWIKKVRDWTHANTVRVLPENKWFDGGDKRFRPGNFTTMTRNLWSSFVVDKETKKIVWEFAGKYKGGLQFPHESHMIPKGLPGEGNVLIFDNGNPKRGSIALEIDPVSEEIVWKYENGRKFFSNGHGSLMRLKDGNTLLSEDFRNRILQVNRSGDIVWKAVGPAGLRRASHYESGFCKELQ